MFKIAALLAFPGWVAELVHMPDWVIQLVHSLFGGPFPPPGLH